MWLFLGVWEMQHIKKTFFCCSSCMGTKKEKIYKKIDGVDELFGKVKELARDLSISDDDKKEFYSFTCIDDDTACLKV